MKNLSARLYIWFSDTLSPLLLRLYMDDLRSVVPKTLKVAILADYVLLIGGQLKKN